MLGGFSLLEFEIYPHILITKFRKDCVNFSRLQKWELRKKSGI